MLGGSGGQMVPGGGSMGGGSGSPGTGGAIGCAGSSGQRPPPPSSTPQFGSIGRPGRTGPVLGYSGRSQEPGGRLPTCGGRPPQPKPGSIGRPGKPGRLGRPWSG